MYKVAHLFQTSDFDPETIEVLAAAYEKACKALHDTGQPEIVREVIATRIIAAAKLGERNPDKLCEEALTAFGDRTV